MKKINAFIGSFQTYQDFKKKLHTDSVVAFIGRSNAGKSSLINSIFGYKVAKSSQTPGKTQAINLFRFSTTSIVADLPGYGFASKSKTDRKDWIKNSTDFLFECKHVKLLVLVTDIRRGLLEADQDLMNWCKQHCSFPILIVLTKKDKLKQNEANLALQEVKKKAPISCIDVFSCSNTKQDSISEIKNFMNNFLKDRK